MMQLFYKKERAIGNADGAFLKILIELVEFVFNNFVSQFL
jgi:hypothetical protein